LSDLLNYKFIVLYETENCYFHLEKISHLAVRSFQDPARSTMCHAQYRYISKSTLSQKSDLETNWNLCYSKRDESWELL